MIDINVPVTQKTGKILTDDEGNKYAETASVPGFHVNSTEAIPEFDAYLIVPATPFRVFAGLESVCYTFPDEATFDATDYAIAYANSIL